MNLPFCFQFPELVEMMGSMYQMMDSRVSLFSRLSKLQGKLDLMLSQVNDSCLGFGQMILFQRLLEVCISWRINNTT